MPRELQVQVITQQGTLYEGEVEYARLPGAQGSFGVMAGHAPLIALLEAGEIMLRPSRPASGPVYIACGPGVAEVRENEVAVLVDTAEMATSIDVARARAAAERARERLTSSYPEVDADRAQSALYRALTRLRVARRS